MDFSKYAQETMDFVKLIEADGARFPGSPEEKAACVKIQQQIKANTGLEPKTEKFIYAPEASIGMINKLGWAAFAFTLLFYLSAWTAVLALIGFVGILVFTFTQIVRYTGMWDFCFKQETAENIVTELPAASGKADYTVYLGAHYDSSWCWKLAVKNPVTALIKTGWGVLGVLTMVALSIVRIWAAFYSAPQETLTAAIQLSESIRAANLTCLIMPLFFLPGFFWISHYTSQDKTIGSPGAMDNLSGIGINMMLQKYYIENPDQIPQNMRLVNICFASEEAGLKGSTAYAKAHKDDGSLENCYFINLDSIADPDHFEAVKGDPWQGTKFDQNLIDLTIEAMKETGKISNPKVIVNPVGGCDSTPMCKLGVPTLTIAAQNPTSTNYYHTCNDKSERIDVSTFETGMEVVHRLIQKIDAQRNAKPVEVEAVADVEAEPEAEVAVEVAVEPEAEVVAEPAEVAVETIDSTPDEQ